MAWTTTITDRVDAPTSTTITYQFDDGAGHIKKYTQGGFTSNLEILQAAKRQIQGYDNVTGITLKVGDILDLSVLDPPVVSPKELQAQQDQSVYRQKREDLRIAKLETDLNLIDQATYGKVFEEAQAAKAAADASAADVAKP